MNIRKILGAYRLKHDKRLIYKYRLGNTYNLLMQGLLAFAWTTIRYWNIQYVIVYPDERTLHIEMTQNGLPAYINRLMRRHARIIKTDHNNIGLVMMANNNTG